MSLINRIGAAGAVFAWVTTAARLVLAWIAERPIDGMTAGIGVTALLLATYVSLRSAVTGHGLGESA